MEAVGSVARREYTAEESAAFFEECRRKGEAGLARIAEEKRRELKLVSEQAPEAPAPMAEEQPEQGQPAPAEWSFKRLPSVTSRGRKMYGQVHRCDVDSQAFRELSLQAKVLWSCCLVPFRFFGGKYTDHTYMPIEQMMFIAGLTKGECIKALDELIQASIIQSTGEMKNGNPVLYVPSPFTKGIDWKSKIKESI